MRKEMIKRISSIFFALVLTFMSAAVPAMNVHATEAGTVLSIQALMQSILLAGGMNTSGYKYTTSGAKQDFRLLMSAILGHGSATDTARINRMMKQAQELETDSFKKQLEDAEDGSTFEYEDFKISKKAANDYKLYVSQKAVGDMSALIKNYAGSSDNEFSKLEEGEYVYSYVPDNTTYIKSVSSSVSSFTSLSSLDDIDDFTGILGVSDYISNAGYSVDEYYFFINSSGSWCGVYAIPLGYTLFDSIFAWMGSNYRGVIDSKFVKVIESKCISSGPSSFSSYIGSIYSSYVKYFDCRYSSSSGLTINEKDAIPPDFYNVSGQYAYCNYEAALKNGDFIMYFTDRSSKYTQIIYTYNVLSKYVSESTSKKYDNTADYVEMEFNSDTSAKLDSYENVGELLNYVSSLSKQLSDLKDAISDSTESNKEQTGQIISSIESQTKIVSDGIAEVVTTVKAQTDAISDVTDAVNAQTGALQDVLAGINDQTLAITDPLKDILSELRDLSITLPKDLTISIPEDKLNVNVAIPDISAEVINNIEVKQDYKALQDTISDAMSGTLADVFVPSAPVVDAMVDNYHHKFGFVDDIRTNMDNVKKTFMGITPTPYLKIPIMKTKSDYDYGFGDYFILDLSWYEVYKPYGDKIISAFMWLFFIWRMFIRLPAIINGAAAGTVMTIDTIGSAPKGTDEDAWGTKKDGEFGATKWLM